MLWITAVLTSLISFLFQRFETIVGLYSFMVLGYLVGTPNYNYNNDAIVYASNYAYRTNAFESGYNWLCNIAGNYIDYSTFRLYSSLVVYFLLFLVIRLFTKRVAAISFFSSIAMFPFDNEQIRNGMLSLFVLLGAYFLIKWNKKGIIPSFLIIYIGSLFHSLGLLFMLIPIIWLFKANIERHFKIYFMIISFVAICLEILGSFNLVTVLSSLVSKLSSRSDVGENIALVYGGGALSLKIWLAFYFITLIMIFTFYKLKKELYLYTPQQYELFLCTIILWGGGLILMSLSVDYLRILRLVGYFYFILVVNLMRNVYFKKKIWLFFCSLSSMTLLFIIQIIVYGMKTPQLESIFHFI